MTRLPANFTEIINAPGGDKTTLNDFFELLYQDLRWRAGGFMRGERANHTLQPTELINEAYIRLAKQAPQQWQNRGHFFAFAANAMRQVLIDYARKRGAIRRGGDLERVTLSEAIAADERDVDLISLDRALSKLEKIDPRGSQLLLLRFFAGLTIPQIVEIVHESETTVKRQLRALKAWLRGEMNQG